MPYVEVTLNAQIDDDEVRTLAARLIALLAHDLEKDPQLSVVRVAAQPSTFHVVGGRAAVGVGTLEAHITAGTTTKSQRESFVAHAQEALASVGHGSHPSYIVIYQHDADSWGFGGRTQAARGAARSGRQAADHP